MSSSVWDVIDQYRIGICLALCVVAMAFIVFGHCYREQIQQVLKNEFFKIPESPIDYWSVSHLLMYAIFGFLIPGYPVTFFVLGAGFELAEDMLSSDKTTQLADCTIAQTKQRNLMCRWSINDDYWYSNNSDVFVNLVGYVLGSSLRTTFF